MNQKKISKIIKAKLAEYHYWGGNGITPPPDLHRNNQEWWYNGGPDLSLKNWYAGDNETNESCRQAYERLVSKGISHIRLFGRPHNPEETRRQVFDQRYIQYLNATGQVVVEEEA